MTPDALFEELSSIVETDEFGTVMYLNAAGRRHRLHGPAVIYANGNCYWYRDGLLHRDNAPAVVYHNGEKHWYQNDIRHRTDGPAVIYPCGSFRWILGGCEMSVGEFERRLVKGNYHEP